MTAVMFVCIIMVGSGLRYIKLITPVKGKGAVGQGVKVAAVRMLCMYGMDGLLVQVGSGFVSM